MAGLNQEAEYFVGEGRQGWKASPPSVPSSGDSVGSVDGRSEKVRDEGSVKHFSANWPTPTSGLNAKTHGKTKFAIFYKGSICVYDGIAAEKVREIMSIAAAAAKSAEMKSGIPFPSLIPTSPSSPSSPQGTSNNLASPQSVCFPAEKSSICRLQEFPLARRQSLQRFLEKRRIRLGSKSPYASPTEKAGDNKGNNFCANISPDFASLKDQKRDFSSVLLSLEGI